jgi:hypothetical protein
MWGVLEGRRHDVCSRFECAVGNGRKIRGFYMELLAAQVGL